MASTRTGKRKTVVKSARKRQRYAPLVGDISFDVDTESVEFESESNILESYLPNRKFIIEKGIDEVLFTKVHIVSRFQALHLESLLDPPRNIYMSLVKDFYENLEVSENGVVFSQVKGMPILFNADMLGSILKLPASGPCPFTKHDRVCEDFPNLSYSEQMRLVIDTPSDKLTVKLSPLSNVLIKIIHFNVLPRKSDQVKVTYQDLILLALLLSETSFNMSLLIIKHMYQCVSNNTKTYPYASLLTRVFEHFNMVSESDISTVVKDKFDESTLSASWIVFDSDGTLSWAPDSDPAFPSPCDDVKPDPAILSTMSKVLTRVQDNSVNLSTLATKIVFITIKGEVSSKNWFNKDVWMAEKTVEELSPPLLPPPAIFGFTRAQYPQKIFDWRKVRNGREPDGDVLDKFVVLGDDSSDEKAVAQDDRDV